MVQGRKRQELEDSSFCRFRPAPCADDLQLRSDSRCEGPARGAGTGTGTTAGAGTDVGHRRMVQVGKATRRSSSCRFSALAPCADDLQLPSDSRCEGPARGAGPAAGAGSHVGVWHIRPRDSLGRMCKTPTGSAAEDNIDQRHHRFMVPMNLTSLVDVVFCIPLGVAQLEATRDRFFDPGELSPAGTCTWALIPARRNRERCLALSPGICSHVLLQKSLGTIRHGKNGLQ